MFDGDGEGNSSPVRVTLGGSKRTFRRAMAKTERMSSNRHQLQGVLLQTAALTGRYDQTLSTWRKTHAASDTMLPDTAKYAKKIMSQLRLVSTT